jgi:hypothetical protein
VDFQDDGRISDEGFQLATPFIAARENGVNKEGQWNVNDELLSWTENLIGQET